MWGRDKCVCSAEGQGKAERWEMYFEWQSGLVGLLGFFEAEFVLFLSLRFGGKKIPEIALYVCIPAKRRNIHVDNPYNLTRH